MPCQQDSRGGISATPSYAVGRITTISTVASFREIGEATAGESLRMERVTPVSTKGSNAIAAGGGLGDGRVVGRTSRATTSSGGLCIASFVASCYGLSATSLGRIVRSARLFPSIITIGPTFDAFAKESEATISVPT